MSSKDFSIEVITTDESLSVEKPVIHSSISNHQDQSNETADISDYYMWSIVLLVCSVFIPAIPSILLSLLTKKFKREGKYQSAKISSRFTLALNILLTCVIICVLVYLITLRIES